MIGQRERVQFLTGQMYRSAMGEERLKKIVDERGLPTNPANGRYDQTLYY